MMIAVALAELRRASILLILNAEAAKPYLTQLIESAIHSLWRNHLHQQNIKKTQAMRQVDVLAIIYHDDMLNLSSPETSHIRLSRRP
jgi:hypothetical protein